MKKTIALVAHDNRKEDLIQWVGWNAKILAKQKLICTGTTGKLVLAELSKHTKRDIDITMLKSGALGGDQQLGSMIAEGNIDIMIFLWDAMTAQPHDVDVKALLRLAVVYNITIANNRSTADYIISSPLFKDENYEPIIKDYGKYINRSI